MSFLAMDRKHCSGIHRTVRNGIHRTVRNEGETDGVFVDGESRCSHCLVHEQMQVWGVHAALWVGPPFKLGPRVAVC